MLQSHPVDPRLSCSPGRPLELRPCSPVPLLAPVASAWASLYLTRPPPAARSPLSFLRTLCQPPRRAAQSLVLSVSSSSVSALSAGSPGGLDPAVLTYRARAQDEQATAPGLGLGSRWGWLFPCNVRPAVSLLLTSTVDRLLVHTPAQPPSSLFPVLLT